MGEDRHQHRASSHGCAAWGLLIVGGAFSALGVASLVHDPKNPFFWVWTSFVSLALISAIRSLCRPEAEWTLEMDEREIRWSSPYWPKSEGCLELADIKEVHLADDNSDILVRTRDHTQHKIPGQCVGTLEPLKKRFLAYCPTARIFWNLKRIDDNNAKKADRPGSEK